MEICVESFDGEKYTVEVGVDDTTADIRRKVATAAELREDGFDMSFGGKLLAAGDDATKLSAGDTVVLTKTKSQKDDAIAALRDFGERELTSERFRGLTDPKLIHLFLQAEVVTEIPHYFLQGGTFSELDLSGVPGVTAVGGSNFLSKCTSLTTLDISGWNNVTQIGYEFLSNCTALKTLDLSGWSNVTRVGDYFLYNCTSLTTLDISGWHNVTRVGNNFLYDCTSLTTLDISGWNNVTHIGYRFLCKCTALRTLDLSGWNNVREMDKCFLSKCSALKTLDLSGWTTVQHIGPSFLYACKIRTSNINVTGSSSVVSECVHDYGGSLVDDTKCKCVCM